MGIRELRPELLKQCDILQAVLAFNYALTGHVKRDLDIIRVRIQVATAKELREIRDRLDTNVERSLRRFGCIRPAEVFAGEFIAATKAEVGIPNVSKAVIESEYFTRFCDGNETWRDFPPHLRLQVHFDWTISDPLIFHYLLPEAILYEDMALAFNLAHGSNAEVSKVGFVKGGNVAVKQHNMHLRTAVLSAYYFVEAYLNGIAFDYHHQKRNTLTQREKDLLLEWDSQNNRLKFVSFESKIKEYQKLILRTSPSLTVSNCKELGVLLGDAKQLRDAIVHQSSKTSDDSLIPKKVQWLISMNFDNTREIVDAAVGFVTRLNKELGANGMEIGWLVPRDAVNGLFPPKAFE